MNRNHLLGRPGEKGGDWRVGGLMLTASSASCEDRQEPKPSRRSSKKNLLGENARREFLNILLDRARQATPGASICCEGGMERLRRRGPICHEP